MVPYQSERMISLTEEQIRAGKRALFRSSHRFSVRLQRLFARKCWNKLLSKEA